MKKVDNAIIGFQIKSINDNISEDRIRSQTLKALEYNLDGFVLVYSLPPSRKVDNSIQAIFHLFKRINDSGKMYCAIIHPELLAELFRKYEVNLDNAF